jgi:hypothetical protein
MEKASEKLQEIKCLWVSKGSQIMHAVCFGDGLTSVYKMRAAIVYLVIFQSQVPVLKSSTYRFSWMENLHQNLHPVYSRVL